MGRFRSRRGRGGAACLALATILLAISNWTTSALAAQAITSSGPLTSIAISDTLNCSVNHTGDSSGEFFDDTACGTFVAVGGSIYGPASIPAGANVVNTPNFVAFTPVSQSAVTGSGTAANPFKIVTVVDAGTTGVRLTETDTYVVGQETYRTDVSVASTSQQSIVLFRAGDCFLQDSDTGFGAIDQSTGSVSCVGVVNQNGTEVPGPRIEQWRPLTPGSHLLEGFYADVWAAIATRQPFNDTCTCNTNLDNGAGLSWSATIPAGGATTFSHLTSLSPAGNQPLTTTKTADAGSVVAGGSDGYTIKVQNPNASAVQLNSISDTLPSGFTYAAGSTSGVTTANPTVAGQGLTWSGPFSVPAGGSVTLHFNVTASTTPGTYFNNAGADGGSFSVVPTGDTAAVTVTQATTSTSTSTTTTIGGTTTTTTGGGTTTTTTGGGTTTTTTGGGTTTTTTGGGTTTTTTGGGTTTTTRGATTTTTAGGGTTTTTAGGGTTTTTTAGGTTTTTTAPTTTTTTVATSTTATTTTASTTTTAPATTTTTTAPVAGRQPTANASPATVLAGQQTTVFGDGFPSATPLNLNQFSDPVFLGSTTSDAAGHYSLVVTIPAGTALGVHQIVVTGGGAQATTTVTVVAPAPVSTGTLVRTGGNVRGILRAGAVAIAIGGVLLLLGARDPQFRR